MRKTYSKPEILFESFAMSTNIAAGCEYKVNQPTDHACAIIGTGNQFVFSGTINGCKATPEGLGFPEDEYNGFCYHVPDDGRNIFNS